MEKGRTEKGTPGGAKGRGRGKDSRVRSARGAGTPKKDSGQNQGSGGRGDTGDAKMDGSSLVGHRDEHDEGGPHGARMGERHTSGESRREAPQDGEDGGLPAAGELTEEAQDLLQQDIRKSTKKVYGSKLNKFSEYCKDRGVETHDCPVETVVNFLTHLRRDLGLEYQTICGYRSAIAKQHIGVGEMTLGQTKMVKRITKACFIEKPPIPRYGDIWDVDMVLEHLEKLHPPESLSDTEFGRKTATLTFILSLSRWNLST